MKTFKRIISIVIATVITFSSMWVYAVSVKADTFLLGDTDCDGDICITDATLVQRDIAQIISLKQNPEYTDFKYWNENGWIGKARPWKQVKSEVSSSTDNIL